MKKMTEIIITAMIILITAMGLSFAQQTAEDHFNLGKKYLEEKNYQKAIESFNSALKIKPELKEANFYLALSLARSGKYNNDVAQLKSETENSAQYAYVEGIISLDNGNYKSAIAHFNEAKNKGMNTADLNNNLGLAYYKNNDMDNAIACYQKAIELDPKNNKTKYNLALAYSKSGKFDKDIEKIKKEAESSATYAYINGIEALESGNYQQAVKQFELALQKEPDNRNAQFALGIAYQESGQFDKALMAFNKVSKESESFGLAKSKNEYKDKVERQLSESAKFNSTDAEGRTMLHIAVIQNDLDAVKFLLKNGIDKNIKDKQGKTALDYAQTKDIKDLLK